MHNELREKKVTFREELQEMINKGISCALEAGRLQERQKGQKSYRDRVERLLYARNGLDILIAALEEELKSTEENESISGMAYQKTENKVVHLLPSGNALGMPYRKADMEALLIRNRRAAARIDRAVNTLSDDPYFEILQLKYTDKLSEEGIAEELCCDPSTIRRNKNRLLERLAVIFFGIDAVE